MLLTPRSYCLIRLVLTYRGRVTHICVSKIISIDSDNGLSPGRRQAITWTNAGIFWTGPLGRSFSEVKWNSNRNTNSFIQESAYKNVVCEMVNILSHLQCVKRIQIILMTYMSEKKGETMTFFWSLNGDTLVRYSEVIGFMMIKCSTVAYWSLYKCLFCHCSAVYNKVSYRLIPWI